MAFKIAELLRNVLVYKMYISSDGGIILVHGFILGGALTFYNFRIYFIRVLQHWRDLRKEKK